MKLLFIVNAPEFFLSHRLPLALAAKEAGYCVQVATGPGAACKKISDHGLIHHCLPISRSGQNPLNEINTIVSLCRLMKRIAPDIVHLVTIKPVLYGGIAARLMRVPAVVVAVSGMGGVFVAGNAKTQVLRVFVKALYKLALGHKNVSVIFQNPDDKCAVKEMVGLNEDQTFLIRGSGVSFKDYPVSEEPEGRQVVAFAARLLKDKGIYEFIQAANILHKRGFNARFLVAGSIDSGNPSTVSEEEREQWKQKDFIEVLGYRKDISAVFGQAAIVVLPSYREGLPKVLIEAAACGKPVITTDSPGCRDAIEANVTGLLIPPRDAVALADAIERLLQDAELRRSMGRAGRAFAEKTFDIRQVVSAHLKIYEKALKK